MKVAKFRKLLKEQSDKMRIKGVGAKFTREGIIVEAAIGNEMRKVNSFFTIIKNFLVNEGIKVDRMNISKTNRTQFSKFMINEAVYVEQEDQEDDELVPTDVNDDEIPDETEAYVDGIVDSMSDVEYTDYVMGSDLMVSDGIPDDEDAIEIVLADDIDSLETDIVDEVEEGEVKVVDINAHNGEGAISERRRVRGRMIKEGGREKMSPRPFVKTKKLINESGGDPDAFKLHIDLINAIYDNPNATAKMIAKELNMPNDVDMIQKAIDIVYPNRRALAEPEDELNESRKQLNEYFVREGDTVEDALAQINLFNDMIFDPQEYNDFYGKKEYAEKAKSIYNEFNEFKNIKINSDEEYFIENMIYDGTDAYGEGYDDDDLKNMYDDQIEQLGELLEMLKNREPEDELNEASTPDPFKLRELAKSKFKFLSRLTDDQIRQIEMAFDSESDSHLYKLLIKMGISRQDAMKFMQWTTEFSGEELELNESRYDDDNLFSLAVDIADKYNVKVEVMESIVKKFGRVPDKYIFAELFKTVPRKDVYPIFKTLQDIVG